ncbi:hypothetical protein MMP64_12260 [Acinetobacter sp. ANC 5659]|uniref:hypothetical protein n=1 Tax=Acinetobacter higginsii TaxID=70347 RepID=UPI0002CE7E73|nr:hypothetical protein [Acinetobacter higginsii]ENX60699.1 hypothetical protein F885_01807 [Acinetobacter higginsii]MCH7318701.1 hypothetical protein [Acinetobacter higginsii]
MKIQLSHIFINDAIEFNNNPKLTSLAKLDLLPKDYNGMACDSALYDATITIISNISLGLLSSWIYDKYKENRIKKPMINGTEIDIENITAEEILSIFAKNQNIDDSEDKAEQ